MSTASLNFHRVVEAKAEIHHAQNGQWLALEFLDDDGGRLSLAIFSDSPERLLKAISIGSVHLVADSSKCCAGARGPSIEEKCVTCPFKATGEPPLTQSERARQIALEAIEEVESLANCFKDTYADDGYCESALGTATALRQMLAAVPPT